MPLEKPIKLADNTWYFHGDLWTAEELNRRWGIVVEPGESEAHAHSSSTLASA
jgi:hypothetical protein